MYNEIIKIQELNEKLLEMLTKTTIELINYANKHNFELPHNIHYLLKKSRQFLDELNHPTLTNKICSICEKLNPENAEYCCYCGSSLNITQISPDLLQSKNNDSSHPKSDRTIIKLNLYNPCLITGFKYLTHLM